VLWPSGNQDQPQLSLIVRRLPGSVPFTPPTPLLCSLSAIWVLVLVPAATHAVPITSSCCRPQMQAKPRGRAGEWLHRLTVSPEEGGRLQLLTPKLQLSILRVQLAVQASRERGVQFNYKCELRDEVCLTGWIGHSADSVVTRILFMCYITEHVARQPSVPAAAGQRQSLAAWARAKCTSSRYSAVVVQKSSGGATVKQFSRGMFAGVRCTLPCRFRFHGCHSAASTSVCGRMSRSTCSSQRLQGAQQASARMCGSEPIRPALHAAHPAVCTTPSYSMHNG
jgi:hypothetical protein